MVKFSDRAGLASGLGRREVTALRFILMKAA
jgi:hypothetical protein